jgi:hypothetical protein
MLDQDWPDFRLEELDVGLGGLLGVQKRDCENAVNRYTQNTNRDSHGSPANEKVNWFCH